MRSSRKVCALLLTACMSLGLLAGCGEKEETVTNNDDTAVKEQEVSQEAENEGDASDEETIVLKLTAVPTGSDGDWNDYWYINLIEEKFNVDIQVEMISSEAEGKIPLLFASDDLPDFFVNGLSSAQLIQYGTEGYLLDLSSYVSEETTPNLWAILEQYPDALSAMKTPDGEIYALRGLDMAVHNQNIARFYINYDWAEQILGKLPENLDEFYEYLVGVKENDMNGNGDPNDEIPLGGCYSDGEMFNVFMPILNAFGYTRMSIEAIDGKVVYVPAEENYKYVLEYIKKLYDEELLDPEFFTQSWEQRSAKDAEYRYGAVGLVINSANQSDPDLAAKYQFLEPLTSEYNSEKITAATGVNLRGSMMITKSCEHPEKLIEIYDWCLSREGTLASLYGPEQGTWEGHEEYGSTFEWVEDDSVLVENIFDENDCTNYDTYLHKYLSPGSGVFPMFRDFNTATEEGAGYSLIEDTREHLEPYYVVNWPGAISYTVEESDSLALVSTDIVSYKDEMVTKMITGEISIEDGFDDYVQGLKDRGLEQLLEVYQTAYDRYMSN